MSSEPTMDSTDPRLRAALAEYLERIDRGVPVDREAFLAEYPDLVAELAPLLETANALEQIGGTPAEPNPPDLSTHSQISADIETIAPGRQGQPGTKSGGLPKDFGRYRIIKALGQGAMGVVYLAQDTQLNRQVALKTSSFDNDHSGELLERFYREARSAATLRHPNICPVHDVGEIDGRHYISLAYIEGRTLATYVNASGRLQERQVLSLIRKLALALHEAHEHEIVHRDLKPANIMVDQRGEPVIMDFGLARVGYSDEESRLTQVGMIVGSPAYMAPEQIGGQPELLTGAADQYGLGVILFELLVGHPPFRGPVTAVVGQILTQPPPRLSALRSDVSPAVEALCLKMLAKSPDDRFASMKQVADEIAALLRGSSAENRPPAASAKSAVEAPSTPETDVPRTSLHMALVQEARRRLKQRDYPKAIEMLQQIPEAERAPEAAKLLAHALKLMDEVNFVLQEMEAALQSRDGAKLARRAQELVSLKPDHPRARQVRELIKKHGPERALSFLAEDSGATNAQATAGDRWGLKLVAGGILAALLLAAVIWLGSGKTRLKVTVNDPTIEVTFRGNQLSIQHGASQINVDPGEEELTIRVAGVEFQTPRFTLKKGTTTAVEVERVDGQVAVNVGGNELAAWPLEKAGTETAVVPAPSGNNSSSVAAGPVPAHFRHGVKAEIFDGKNFEKKVLERIDPTLECLWDWGAPAREAPVDQFSVRFSGWLRAPKSGHYRIVSWSDDGVRVSINGKMVIDRWQLEHTSAEVTVRLTEEPQSILVESFDHAGPSWMSIFWQGPGDAGLTPIPSEALYPDEASAKVPPKDRSRGPNGLVAEYFDKSFTTKVATQRVYQAHSIWYTGTPVADLPVLACVRYSGFLIPPVTGEYQLVSAARTGMMAWLDGNQVMHASFPPQKRSVRLEANRPYALKIEQQNFDDQGSYYLHWIPPGEPKEVPIPPECLFPNLESIPSAGGNEVDLLAALDPLGMGNTQMRWERKGKAVAGTCVPRADKMRNIWKGFEFPTEVGGNYEVEIEFLQRAFWPVQIDFPLQDTALRVSLAGDGSEILVEPGPPGTSGEPPIKNRDATLAADIPQTLRVRVEQSGDQASIEATLNGLKFGTYRGVRSRIKLPLGLQPDTRRVKSWSLCSDMSKGYLELRRAVYRTLPAQSESPSQTSTAGAATAFDGTNRSAQLPKEAGLPLRWLSLSVHDPAAFDAAANLANLIEDRSWQTHGNALTRKARERGVPTILAFHRSDYIEYLAGRDPDFESRLHAFVKANRDVIAGVSFLAPYTHAERECIAHVGPFGRRLKAAFPGLEYWVSYIESPGSWVGPLPAVPPEVDVVQMEAYFAWTPQAVQAKFDQHLPKWKTLATGRPLMFRWVTLQLKSQPQVLKTEAGTVDRVLATAVQLGLSGVGMDFFGPRKDGYSTPIDSDPRALAELTAFAQRHRYGEQHRLRGKQALVPLSALNSEGMDDASPWVLPSGLAIYFTREQAGKDPTVFRAERLDLNTPFTSPQPVLNGRHMAVAADETYAVLFPGRYVAAGVLSEISRAKSTDPWSTPRPIPSLASQANPKSPWLSADGLTLVYQRKRMVSDLPGRTTEFAICRRKSRTEAWGEPALLTMSPGDSLTQALTWPCLSEDLLTLTFCHGGDRHPEVYAASRKAATEPFGNFARIDLDGRPLIGRSPRVCAATGELYLSSDRDPGKPDSDLFCVTTRSRSFLPEASVASALSPVAPSVTEPAMAKAPEGTPLKAPAAHPDPEKAGAPGDREPQEVRHGLKAEVFEGQNFERKVCEQIEPSVECFWELGAPAEEAPVDNFSVRFTGWLRAPRTGRYKLFLASKDGARLKVNNQTVIDNWKLKPDLAEVSVELTQDPQPIEVHVANSTLHSWVSLLWQPAGNPTACHIPATALFPDLESARSKASRSNIAKTGLVAEYFDKTFSRRLVTDRVYRLEELWGPYSPRWGLPSDSAVRYSGILVPPTTGNYKLIAGAREHLRVWIDDKPTLEARGMKAGQSAVVELVANKPHEIRVEVVTTTHGAHYLHWIPPQSTKEVGIPPECLFPSKAAARQAKSPGDTTAIPADPPASPGPGEWIDLFNGRDLSGWEGSRDYWSVEDGAITGENLVGEPMQKDKFLVWTGGEVSDFELTFQYKIDSGNSGMQYRSHVISQDAATGPILQGYQADFESGVSFNGANWEEGGRKVLALPGERVRLTADPADPSKMVKTVIGRTELSHDQLQAAIRHSEWNAYRIVARGNTLQHFINGNMTTEVIDDHTAKAVTSGKLALQLLSRLPTVVHIRRIRLLDLTEKVAATQDRTMIGKRVAP